VFYVLKLSVRYKILNGIIASILQNQNGSSYFSAGLLYSYFGRCVSGRTDTAKVRVAFRIFILKEPKIKIFQKSGSRNRSFNTVKIKIRH
jgi:hypothetical protein